MPPLENMTLQEMCLDAIIMNFDTFCRAFRVAENSVKFYLEFIQRTWSCQILHRLFEKCLLKNEHLPIVINRYTKELNFVTLVNCDIGAVISRLKEVGDVVEKVSLKDIPVFFNINSIWIYLPNVHTIDLQYTNASDHTIRLISENCPRVKHLSTLGCAKISDAGLIYLTKQKLPLESLNVEGTGITYKGVASALENIPSLKNLWHGNVPRAILQVLGLNDSLGTDNLNRVFNLHNMVISNNSLRPENHLVYILKVCQATCPFIEHLTIYEIISEKQLSECYSFPELKSVNLKCSLLSSQGLSIDEFLKLRGNKIKSLSLMSFSLSIDVLLRCCPSLEYLTLDYPQFESIHLCDVPSNVILSNLKVFYLHNFEISEDNVKYVSAIISSSPNLEELNIVNCELSDEIMYASLNYPKNLRVLNLSNTSVQASFLEEVVRVHKKLNVLRIDNTGITTDEYDDLMDIVDDIGSKVHVIWADYNYAIKQLYSTDLDSVCQYMRRQVMKL